MSLLIRCLTELTRESLILRVSWVGMSKPWPVCVPRMSPHPPITVNHLLICSPSFCLTLARRVFEVHSLSPGWILDNCPLCVLVCPVNSQNYPQSLPLYKRIGHFQWFLESLASSLPLHLDELCLPLSLFSSAHDPHISPGLLAQAPSSRNPRAKEGVTDRQSWLWSDTVRQCSGSWPSPWPWD